jgi:ribonucleoside-diphosphate reductase alpha chain
MEPKTTVTNGLDEIANFTFTSKYARYSEKYKRRESWKEAITRVEEMHVEKYNFLSEEDKQEIKWAFDLVRDKRAVPSMRSMQFGGPAVTSHNARMFNCSCRHIDSIRSFAECFYLLLCGCGVDFGLTKKYLNRLPDLVDADSKTGTVLTYAVEDSIEGWADSLEAQLNSYFKNTAYSGRKIVFDYSKIRRKGAKLKTGGGKAPGYSGLKNAHIKIKKLFDHVIEKNEKTRIKPIDAYDILMHCSDAVLSGGIRRAATSVVFDHDDDEMMNAKTGDWVSENPQRARSNNSVLFLRKKITETDFKKVLQSAREFGEPGFIFADHEDMLSNPCREIGFVPVTKDGRCGVQFCNLTSINGAKIHSVKEFRDAAKAASIIGTLQAGYTNFHYLSNTSRELTEEEALLGVSITGIMDNPKVLLNAKNQKECAQIAVETNQEWAKKLGINPAARVTCIKPEGTSSLVLGSASGIHPHHSRKYLRRIQCNKIDNVYQYFRLFNDKHCEESVWSANKTDDVVTFPIEITNGALTKKDLDAFKHLEYIKTTQQNWVLPGTTKHNKKKTTHSVSCTVLIKEDQWDEVATYLYENRDYFAAVSLLASTGDKDFDQAPMEDMVTEKDEKLFDRLSKSLSPVDYTVLEETTDETNFQQVLACAGGNCEIN